MVSGRRSVLQVLAAFASALGPEDLPERVVRAAELRILDYLGTVFHVCREDPWRPVREVLEAREERAESTVIGRGTRLSRPSAAMVNTYPYLSDGSRHAGGHCAWIVVPAALAAAEAQPAPGPSGRDLVVAVVAGYEVLVRVGRAIYPAVQDRGFQPTTARGPLGAAAATSKILGLDAARTCHALSIAATLGGGLMGALSPWTCYALQNGRATESGVLAALAASAGSEGNAHVLETAFLPAFGPPRSVAVPPNAQGRPFAVESTYLKTHFGCRHAHGPIDTVLDLVRRDRIACRDVAALRLRISSTAMATCNRRGSRSPSEAAYDLPAILAVVLVHGDASFARFTPEVLASPEVTELANRVEVAEDPAFDAAFPERSPSAVDLTTRDGVVHSHRRDLPRGEPEEPLDASEIEAKFHALASATLDASARRRVVEFVAGLASAPDLRALPGVLAGARG